MLGFVDTILASPLTPITLALTSVAVIIMAFARGWIVSAFQVRQLLNIQNLRIAEANKRADEWKSVSDKKDAVIAAQAQQIELLKSIADNTNRVLAALPAPKGGSS